MNTAHKLLISNNCTFTISRYFSTSNEWFKATLLESGKMTHDTALLTFQLPEEKKKLEVPVGYNFSVRPSKIEQSGIKQPAQRSYTPLLQERDDGTVRLAVKVYEEGPLTQYLSKLKVGESVEMKGPKGRLDAEKDLTYELEGDKKKLKTLCMVAGGSGITPMLQVSENKLWSYL